MSDRIIRDRTPAQVIRQNTQGPAGPAGVGSAWHLVATGLPGADLGSDGDYALVQDTLCIYGPRATAGEVTDWPYIACIEGTVLAADLVAALEGASEPTAENPFATLSDLVAILEAIPETPGDIGAVAEQSGRILGQSDVRTDLVAENGGTCTLNYALGNAFTIDASALTSGQAFTIAVSNWPVGDVYSALSLQITVGAAADLSITWPTGVVAPDLTASKRNRFVLSTWDNGTTVDLDAQEAL